MNVLEKAEKALEFLKANERSAKGHELQAAAGTLGRCLGALGTRPNCARHYANLLHSAIPTLLFLASNESAEVRLVGDEALNRAIVGGFAFHSHKTNIILQNQIDHTKNARWIRAALSRICLGDCWLRPGAGKIRSQAQTLFPKLSQIVRETNEIQLVVEALESNLPRLLDALAEYTTDEEISELSKALLSHVESNEPALRRGIATCVAHLCSHREPLLTNILSSVFDKLWPLTTENRVVVGWFCVIKAIFQINEISKFSDSELFGVQDYLELYQLCVHYIENSTTDHNIQNAVMECLLILLSSARDEYRQALLEKKPKVVKLDEREFEKGHRRNISACSVISRRYASPISMEPRDAMELSFTGALQLGSLLHLSTPSLSVEDLTIQTSARYCARLQCARAVTSLASKSIRVSVKSSALNCLSEILQLYPQVMTMYLDKDADVKNHNISGSSEGTDSNQEHVNEFILERNVCYQDSLTDSLSQDLLNRSLDSESKSQVNSKKDSKSLEKSTETEKSSKDVPSIDSKAIFASVMTDSTNPNMSNSNFTTNSNMTGSNDPTTGYPMSSSGDILSSSIDLDIKFDHFGESTTNLDNLKDFEKKESKIKRPLKRTDEVQSKDAPDNNEAKESIESVKDFEFQHISEIFVLYCGHNDPQIRGLVRVCIGSYLVAALDYSHGDYSRWRNLNTLPKEVFENVSIEKLIEIVLKGLSDEIHSTVNHTLSALTNLSIALCESAHWALLIDGLNSLVSVETNNYWLCRVNLCKLYEKLPYQKLFMLYSGYHPRSRQIMDTLIRLLADQDQKVRNAAAQAISSVISTIYVSKHQTPANMVSELAKDQTLTLTPDSSILSLWLVRDMYFYSDLPKQLRDGPRLKVKNGLGLFLGDLMQKLMASNCRYYTQGLLEALQAICNKWNPWKHIEEYSDQGILSYCLDNFDYCNGTVVARTILLNICSLVYPVDIHNIMRHKTSNRDIFERDTTNINNRWQHLENTRLANMAEKFLQVTLKMLNVLVHLTEEVNPNVHLNKGGIALPGSPVRRKTQDPISVRKGSTPTESVDDKGSLRKKPPPPASSLKANFSGHFYNEPFYMKFYENLRAVYSNHKINLDPKSSMFHTFLTAVLNCLAIQLELATEKEVGNVTEEILYYLKCIMPLCPEKTVNCITQLLKCLFGTNMLNQYNDFMSIADKYDPDVKTSFYTDVMLVNSFKIDEGSRRSSVCSSSSQKFSSDSKNPKMMEEKRLLMAMENFAKNKSDRKWNTNKKELERYIRLFEPVVIQALKSYTMQNDIPLQCQVLTLLNQLLTLRLIQLCDGLMASGAHVECIAGLEPVAVRVFSNMNGSSVLGRAQQQEAQATREVLFYMLQKTMYQPKVLNLVACVLSLSQEHSGSYYRWSELASDTLLNLLSQRSIELDTQDAIEALERLIDSVYRDVLLEQSRVEQLLKILFKAPPEQATTPLKLKLRYLSIIMVLLRKVLALIPETEILLSIDYLKATSISPQSIFFNVKPDVDPLNVQNVNENCANLSPDVILVRFLFKTLTYAIMEVDGCYDSLNSRNTKSNVECHKLLYSVCVNIIIQVKHMLQLTTGCLFPLTAKTAQSILHNEQSGLNTGLYSPEENIPLDDLNLICLRSAHRIPLLTVHWSHLLIRLNFLSHKYWQKLVGFARNLPLSADNGDTQLLRVDILQIAVVMAYCEYFVENGLSEAVHLTWLLVNRVHILVSQYREGIVQALVSKVQQTAGASGLLLQAVAARFAKLAIDRCKKLKEMPVDQINVQLSKEDVQVALELLQRDEVHLRLSALVMELNSLATSVFDLSPLDLSHDRAINPQYITTTFIDAKWFLNQVKSRCCQTDGISPKISKINELANLMSNLSNDDLTAVMACPEFDRKILCACFKVASESFLREFFNILSVYESKEYEKDSIREQREMKLREEMTASIDSNKLNVVNTLHVFKRSDSRESKSQFFIPITEGDNLKDNFGNLQISDEHVELAIPELPGLYQTSVTTFDKSLIDVIRLFPKQNRPLSQSENFNLNIEQTIDRYTRRCHQVFQDKLFYQEFVTIQTVLTGFLDSLFKILSCVDENDCDMLDKCIENVLPSSLVKNIAVFSVISLQYMSFLIKNKKIVESPVHADVSFRVTVSVTDNVSVDNMILVTVQNVAKALEVKEIWTELNFEGNCNRNQSAISCLYAIVKYLVKDTKPLILKQYMKTNDSGPRPDMMVTGDKLVTLLDYWEQSFYGKDCGEFLGKCYRVPLESMLVSLSRLDIVSNIALIPPIAWSSVAVVSKQDQLQKIDLPLQALQDMDVLEAFLFRVNLIGWSSKKQFEEMWVGLLGAFQGNGTHWAVKGITQLLHSTAPIVRGKGMMHVPRDTSQKVNDGMQRLRNIVLGTSAYKLFDEVNLERIPLLNDGLYGYHYAQYNTKYLKLASDIIDDASFKVKRELRRTRKNKEVDINSCLQILMDVTTQMLDPKAPTGLSARVALISCIIESSGSFSSTGQWWWAATQLITLTGLAHSSLTQYCAAGRALLAALSTCLCVLDGFEGLQELSTVHQKLLKSLSASYAPLRHAALHGCLLQLYGKAQHVVNQHSAANPYQELVSQLNVTVKQYLVPNCKISLYEQSLYWAVLFTLVELGYPDLIYIAVDFLLTNPRHYCADLVVKGIANTLRKQVLSNELKNSVTERLLNKMKNYSEHHAVQILMVHMFTGDTKLLSPNQSTDVSNMDPDVLMNSMERITLLYKALRETKHKTSRLIISSTLEHLLGETLPPAATLSRVVIEMLDWCKDAEEMEMGILGERSRLVESAVHNAGIVFQVFETSIAQNQLPVLSGWIFEALCHLLNGKITSNLLPYCLLTLLVSASSNPYIRKTSFLSQLVLKLGFMKNSTANESWGIFREHFGGRTLMSFNERRLLCLVACRSNFSGSQLERLKELCDSDECLRDVLACLDV
ncbi:hypothetical protein K1T71_013718 [Dendrolimus kikuchii]|uniref:Uncharacterized protein n=1 Tax=Dendrolimus kikuchii TaxID=765133 RepID=A0ACC1CHI5_9NEOP|nr:hypothetical protein K1T71_013718 [Dendrolimus kikuchii]